MKGKRTSAILFALLAAVFYAINMPLSKLLLEHIPSTILAGLLYLGAGIGTAAMFFGGKKGGEGALLTRADLPYTVGMILLDILAPVLLMLGLTRTSSSSASLLNNFEIVATAIIALAIFRERISGLLWGAIALITIASLMLSFEDAASLKFSYGSLLVLLACACWGLENNCTRAISAKNTSEIVMLKGLCSGAGSLIIGLAAGKSCRAPSMSCPRCCSASSPTGSAYFSTSGRRRSSARRRRARITPSRRLSGRCCRSLF